MIDHEMLDAMKDLLTPINLRLESMEYEIAGVKHEMADIRLEIADVKHEVADNKMEISSLRLEMNRGFRKYNDEIQTLVAVLRAKNIMPKEINVDIFPIAK